MIALYYKANFLASITVLAVLWLLLNILDDELLFVLFYIYFFVKKTLVWAYMTFE